MSMLKYLLYIAYESFVENCGCYKIEVCSD